MPRVFIPPLLRPLTGDVEEVTVDAKNVRQVVAALESQFPGIESRLCDDEGLQPGLTVAVDGNISSLGLLQKVGENSEVHFLPAIGGG